MLPQILKNLRIPVIAAPLFIISNPKLVVAQCKAGVIGSMPALNARPREQLEVELKFITEELDKYNQEILNLQKDDRTRAAGGEKDPITGYAAGGEHNGPGEVAGPGTGTSDSVPARLSDGEFVLTAKAVRGAGGGDRDIGAARIYDMMADLEATA